MRRFFDVLESVGGFFDVVTYTGNGGTQNIELGFQPDLTWVKIRTQAYSHLLMDSVRGGDFALYSNDTAAETGINNNFGGIDFVPNGIVVNSSAYAVDGLNKAGDEFVAWNFKAGGAAVQNTDGTITSQVSANVDAGFSIVGWTGDGSASATVGHGLSGTPDFIILKDLTDAGAWNAAQVGLASNEGISLQNSAAAFTSMGSNGGITYANLSATNFGFATGSSGVNSVNANGNAYIAYCFHSVDGQKIGSYTGNGSATGPVVTTGFEPSFLLIKRTDSTGNWVMIDNQRSLFNPRDKALYSNLSNAETTAEATDFLTNGFQPMTTSANINASGGTYIYLAIK